MNQEVIKQFWDIINMLETTLYALKWKNSRRDVYANDDSIISVYEIVLRMLKECCINNIGCLDE